MKTACSSTALNKKNVDEEYVRYVHTAGMCENATPGYSSTEYVCRIIYSWYVLGVLYVHTVLVQ